MFGARTKHRELILLVPTAKRNNRTPIIDKRLSSPKIQPFSQHKHSRKRLRRRNEQAHFLGVDGPFPVQRTTDVHQPFGTDKSVPYANSGVLY